TKRFSLTKKVPTTVCLLTEHLRPFGLVSTRALEPRANPDPKLFEMAFGVESKVLTLPYQGMRLCKAENPDWSPELKALYLGCPNDPRYRRLADEIVAKLPPHQRKLDFMRILATRIWIEENITYSLKRPEVSHLDMANDFLFGDRRGKC